MTDDEVRVIRAQLRLLQRRLRAEVLPVAGLSRTSMQVLGSVADVPGGSQPGRIAEARQMSSPNVAAALRQLEKAGFVRREKDPTDSRRVLVFVTAAGSALVADFRNERDTWFGRAVDTVLDPGEQRQLLAAGRLIERLARYEPGALA